MGLLGGSFRYNSLWYKHNIAILTATSLGLCLAQQANAQAVSPVTVTPQNLAPAPRDSGFSVDIPTADALQAPPGAETLAVTLGDVVLDGGFTEVHAETDAVLVQLRGQRVSLAQIYYAASRIEAIHARAGYILARISVPPQELRDGSALRLTVTDGFIESIDVSQLPTRIRAAVHARTRKLEGRGHLTLRDIEEPLLIASQVPGLTLRSTLMRGAQAGGTRLILEGEHRPVTGALTLDNNLDPSLGRWGVTFQLGINSALGLGEQIYGFASSDYRFRQLFDSIPRNRVLGAGANLPIGEGRFSLNPEVVFARTSPIRQPGAPQLVGVLRRLRMQANATLAHTRHTQAGLSASVEQVAESYEIPDFNTAINRDRYMAMRLGGSYGVVTAGGAQYGLAVQLSQGLGGLGSISEAQALADLVPFSRQGSANDFTKLVPSAYADWSLDQRTRFRVSARGQYTFDRAVFRAEQFTLEGRDGLSAYVGGLTALDQGVVARSELSHVLVARSDTGSRASTLTPYLFAAFGAGRLVAPTALETSRLSAFNLGIGARSQLLGQLGISVEYARGFSDHQALDQVDRVNVSIGLQF